jgi:serpin B
MKGEGDMARAQRIIIAICAAALLAAGCKSKPAPAPHEVKKEAPPPAEAKPESQPAPEKAPMADMKDLAEGNNGFGLGLFKQLGSKAELKGKNIFYSPLSVYSALLMAHAGAKGGTRSQMREVMRLTMDGDRLNRVIKHLYWKMGRKKNTLSVANRLWGQKGFAFYSSFLDLTKDVFGAGLEQVDFKGDPESAADRINAWSAEKTTGKIKQIVDREMFDALTRLVLTNAIYFNGTWEKKFDKKTTREDYFFLTDGTKAKVSMMGQQDEFRYASIDGLLLLEMDYIGREMSMWVLLPAPPAAGKGTGAEYAGALEKLETSLTKENLDTWMSSAEVRTVTVALPRFTSTSLLSLDEDLKAMGMKDPFSPESADFSGMNEVRQPDDKLYIAKAVHKAYVDVNEEGTEAAAVTALVGEGAGMPPKPAVFRADHPFLYLIRDNESGCILFLGRMLDPTAAK